MVVFTSKVQNSADHLITEVMAPRCACVADSVRALRWRMYIATMGR
jgi:hypothetical protein